MNLEFLETMDEGVKRTLEQYREICDGCSREDLIVIASAQGTALSLIEQMTSTPAEKVMRALCTLDADYDAASKRMHIRIKEACEANAARNEERAKERASAAERN